MFNQQLLRPSLFCIGLVGLAVCSSCGSPNTDQTARALLNDVAAAMGANDVLAGAGPFSIHATGTLNKTAEGQGYSPASPSVGEYRETVAVDPAGDAVLWLYDERRYDGTREHFGESYTADTLQYLLIHDAGVAMPVSSASFAIERHRLRRRIPHLLVRELLSMPTALSIQRSESGMLRLVGNIDVGVPVSISIDSASSVVRRVDVTVNLPARGQSRIEWWFDDYREVAPGILLPQRYGSLVNGIEYTNMTVDSVPFHGSERFRPNDELRTLNVRDRDSDTPSQEELTLVTLANGVYVVPQVRSGFAPLVVEFDSFLVVVDAPASFPMLGHIPPDETDPGPSMSWATERLVDALERLKPGKRIAFAVMTHHHEDHIGGIRAMVAAGATVLATSGTIAEIQRLVRLTTPGVDDRLVANPVQLRFEDVSERRTISDGTQTIHVVPMGENPHAVEMLIVHVPSARAVYVSDLVTPAPLDRYPAANHVALDRAFFSWLATSGLQPDSVWAMHGSATITRAHVVRLDSLFRRGIRQ